MELPLALRRETRTNAGKPPVRYGYEHDIANGVSDSYVSPAHKAFIASLQSVSIPKDWKAAKLDPRWKERRNEGGAWCIPLSSCDTPDLFLWILNYKSKHLP